VLCEGSGHAGVGSVLICPTPRSPNARCKVIIVTSGGIGRPMTKSASTGRCLKRGRRNHRRHHQQGARGKNSEIARFVWPWSQAAKDGTARGHSTSADVVQPDGGFDSRRTAHRIADQPPTLDTLVDDVVVGAMGAQNAIQFFKPGTLLITPGDREDIVLAAARALTGKAAKNGGHRPDRRLRPGASVLRSFRP